MNYATLSAVKPAIGLKAANADDALLGVFLQWATAQIDQIKNRYYEPRRETHTFNLPRSGASSFGIFEPRLQPIAAQPPLRLDDDLLEIVSLTNGDGEELTDYVLEPANVSPKTRIRLINGATWNADNNGQTEQVIAVTAIWGSHDRYSAAWKFSGKTVQDNPLSSGATTITVAAITGFEVGQLLRLENEFVLVQAVNTVTGTPPTATTYNLTVERGVNGTIAAGHSKETPISIWQVQGNISQACARLVKWRYVQKDVDIFDKTYNGETGIVSVPTAIPSDVLALLGPHKASI